MEQSRFTTVGMGFYDDLIKGLDGVIKKRFENKPYRLEVAAKTTATHVDRIRNGERQKFLLSVGRILDAAGLRLVEGSSVPEDEYAFIPLAHGRPGQITTSPVGPPDSGEADFFCPWLLQMGKNSCADFSTWIHSDPTTPHTTPHAHTGRAGPGMGEERDGMKRAETRPGAPRG